MIRHVVLVRFRSDLTEAEIGALFEELHQIEGRLPGLRAITSGRSESPEKMERGYMHGFVADFDDWAALEAYQNDPGHQVLGSKLVAKAQNGKDGILCFDIEVADRAD
ncbi:MAG: Dabb family protein [Nitratireductor sp.]|nr:Dabb family protein [Nitratireductor sp.]